MSDFPQSKLSQKVSRAFTHMVHFTWKQCHLIWLPLIFFMLINKLSLFHWPRLHQKHTQCILEDLWNEISQDNLSFSSQQPTLKPWPQTPGGCIWAVHNLTSHGNTFCTYCSYNYHVQSKTDKLYCVCLSKEQRCLKKRKKKNRLNVL